MGKSNCRSKIVFRVQLLANIGIMKCMRMTQSKIFKKINKANQIKVTNNTYNPVMATKNQNKQIAIYITKVKCLKIRQIIKRSKSMFRTYFISKIRKEEDFQITSPKKTDALNKINLIKETNKTLNREIMATKIHTRTI